MQLIFLALTLSVIWLNLTALTVKAQKYLPNPHIARSTGLVGLVLVLFFIEHFVGLGQLNYLWPITTSISAYVAWSGREKLHWRAEWVFILAFLYAFSWRFLQPNINVSSERITDLYFISNYMSGVTLPPLDNWYPPHRFDFYYAFQHYGAALLGRIFNLEVGTSYNLAFALLMALPITLAWSVASYFIHAKWARLLLVASLVFGGTGLSPLLHLVFKGPATPTEQTEQAQSSFGYAQYNDAFQFLVRGARFIGSHDEKAHQDSPRVNKQMAEWLFPINKPTPEFELRVLPLENFGYQFFVGDYHPPIGGFFLLLLALALMATIEAGVKSKLSQALLGLTIPLMMITNTWVFPLQGFLICGWIGYRYWIKQTPNWFWLIGGGLAGAVLIYPFLIGFTSGGVNTPVKLVTGDNHTPWPRFLALFWPLLVLMVLSLLDIRWRKWSLVLVVTLASLLLISEFIYIDDPSGGKFVRTNTVMKWWGYIYVTGIVSLGAVCLGSSLKRVKLPAILVLLLVNVYAYDVARFLIYSGKTEAGKIQGHQWLTKNPVNRDMFNYLKQAPFGVVLENLPKNAYMQSSVYAIFNDKPAMLGWPSHLRTWHDQVPQVWGLTREVRNFYQGKQGNTVQWLLAREVRYIIFDQQNKASHFDAINTQIKSQYNWLAFNAKGQRPIGIWVKQENKVKR